VRRNLIVATLVDGQLEFASFGLDKPVQYVVLTDAKRV
jgi:hypothetical protein